MTHFEFFASEFFCKLEFLTHSTGSCFRPSSSPNLEGSGQVRVQNRDLVEVVSRPPVDQFGKTRALRDPVVELYNICMVSGML